MAKEIAQINGRHRIEDHFVDLTEMIEIGSSLVCGRN